jgi:hypothetical protein
MDDWFHDLFMISAHKPARKMIPVSCIQSAEYIIQTYHEPGLAWKQGVDLNPHVYMHFGSGPSYNITTTEDVHLKPTAANQDFDFVCRPPQPGEGVAFINVSGEEFNMHFMAVLAISGSLLRSGRKFVISNLNEGRGAIKQRFLDELVTEDAENIKTLSGPGNIWKEEKRKYQAVNGGDFRMALLSVSKTRPMT